MKYANKKPNKLTITLIVIAGVLVVILAGLLIFLGISGKEPVETVPPTVEVTEEPTAEPTAEPTETEPAETDPVMLAHMAALYEKNNDIAGWVKIEGTKIDYPFVYTPEDFNKYLHMNIDGKHDYAGAIMMDQRCTDDPESNNVILHGHNMKNKTMFNNLMNYVYKSYWEEHPTIYYSNLYEEREYEIIAVLEDRVYKTYEDVFKFYEFTDPQTEEEFNEGIEYFKKNSLYDTGLTAEYGDRLLMLVTCAYHVDNGRFVVVAREIVNEPEVTATEAG